MTANIFKRRLDFLDQAEKGNGPPEGKFMKLGGKVNFGVLSSKIDVIWEKGGHQPRFHK